MAPAIKRPLARMVRYVVIPALLVALDTVTGYLQAGTFDINWNTVGVVSLTALLAGLSKFARDEFNTDIKVV